MISKLIIAYFVHTAVRALAQAQLYPPCELCGCEYCEAGNFPVGNPNGVISIPDEFLDQAPPGFTAIPCSLLDFAGRSGQIPPDLCSDELRLLDEFRSTCGCPALPAKPTLSPVLVAPIPPVPTLSPVVVSQPSTSTINETCEICGCSDCPPGQFPLGNPSGAIPIPPEFRDQAPPGFTEIPCSLLDFAGQTGQIPIDLCTDALRLLPEFRQICGCPPLPSAASVPPSFSPSRLPSSRPSSAPVVATLTPVISPAITMAPVAKPASKAPFSHAPQIQPTIGNSDGDDDNDDDDDNKSGEGYKHDCEANKFERTYSEKENGMNGEKCAKGGKKKGGKGKKKGRKGKKKGDKGTKTMTGSKGEKCYHV